jgi:hypothetical protein
MVREDILEGLKSAIAQGEPLNQAMISFFNAGYTRAEIQEAAQALQGQQLTQGVQQPGMPPQVQQPLQQPGQPIQPPIQPQQGLLPGKPVQVASQYGQKKKPGKALIIVLAIFLAVLIGILSVIFIFKDQLTSLLNNLI